LRWPRAIIANSQAARAGVDEFGVDPDSILILNNVIDLAEFDERSSARAAAWNGDGPPVALAVGRMCAEKRFDRFLAALALARRASPVVRGVIVGDGPLWASLHEQAHELGLLPDGVAFLGRRSDVPALLASADLLVLSSDHEGCPNVVMEAMAARRPVVTTPAGDAPALVEDGTSGYVVPFDDIDAMAHRMIALAESPELRRRLGAAGRRRIEEAYSYERLVESLFSAYASIARRHGRHEILETLAGIQIPPDAAPRKPAGTIRESV
jgi:glycosyltransferase involved in cell wall biosynthesis